MYRIGFLVRKSELKPWIHWKWQIFLAKQLREIWTFSSLFFTLYPHVSDSILSFWHRLPAADVACGSGEQPERKAEQLEPWAEAAAAPEPDPAQLPRRREGGTSGQSFKGTGSWERIQIYCDKNELSLRCDMRISLIFGLKGWSFDEPLPLPLFQLLRWEHIGSIIFI